MTIQDTLEVQDAPINDQPSTPSPNTDTMVKFKAGGVEREMPLQEALQWASKGYGADEKFREAAEKLSEAENKYQKAQTAIQWQEDLNAARDGDMDAFRRVAKSWGLGDEEIEAAVTQFEGGGQMQQAHPSPHEDPSRYHGYSTMDPRHLKTLRRMEKFLSSMEESGVDPVKTLQYAKHTQDSTVDEQGKSLVAKTLKEDPTFARILNNDTDSTILNDVWSEVKRRVQSGGARLNSSTIQEASGKVKAYLDVVSKAMPQTSPGVHPGVLGGAPTSDAGIGRLQPPSEPNLEDFQGDLSGFIDAQLSYDAWQAANTEQDL